MLTIAQREIAETIDPCEVGQVTLKCLKVETLIKKYELLWIGRFWKVKRIALKSSQSHTSNMRSLKILKSNKKKK